MKSLYHAHIYHKRLIPKINEFAYRGFYIKFSLEEKENLKSRLFGVNKFNLFSFFDKDHGYRDGSSLDQWSRDILLASGIKSFNGKIILQTFPRVLGYVFNPVSFWFCYEQDKIVAIICEVNNTFGESHNYVLKNDPSSKVIQLNKRFHVSPFYDVKGEYRFDFTEHGAVKINYYFNNELQLMTSIAGKEDQLTDQNLFKVLFRYPFYTFLIVVLIHYQALKLFIKGITFYPKPEKEKIEVTYE